MKAVLFLFSRFIVLILVLAGVIILTQELQIFPLLFRSLFNTSERLPSSLPQGVESTFVATKDGKKLEVWHYTPANPPQLPYKIALVFHGNGETVDSTMGYLTWLAGLGIEAYSFDFRGYGKSSGWPSEKGIYLDSETVWQWIQKDKGIPAKETLIFGRSLGTGPASYLALKEEVGALVLIAPYTSIPEVVEERPFYRHFAPFIWYRFPTLEYLQKLKNTCVVIAHGKQDRVISFSHSERLYKTFKIRKNFNWIMLPSLGHGDIFSVSKVIIVENLKGCLDLMQNTS